MYPIPNQRQRLPPTNLIGRNFGPYGTRELELARATLIGSVYRGTGEILSRVKMKCGILPTYRGIYQGCEPHPVTNVSFESQSCELMMQDSIPWLRPEDSHNQNGEFPRDQHNCTSEFERSHSMHGDNSDRNILSEDSPRYERSFDRRDSWNNSGRNDSEGRPRWREGGARVCGNSKEMDMFEDSIGRQHDRNDVRDNRSRPSTSTDRPRTPSGAEMSKSSTLDKNSSVNEIVASSSSDTKPALDRKRKRQENVAETASEKSKKYKNALEIISSDDSDDCEIDEEQSMLICFKCDLCDFTSNDGIAVRTHLKNKMHYSASKYIGGLREKCIVPRVLVKSMEFKNHRAMYKSVIPVCPNCRKIFPNVHMCRSHNQTQHKTESREYGLSVVKEVVVINLIPAVICSVCKENFPTISKLNSHMTSMKHYFFRKPREDETVVAFCKECRLGNKKFKSFYDAQAHVYERHSDCEMGVCVSIVFIEKLGKVHVMLPRGSRDSFDNGEGLVDEIADTKIGRKMGITKRKSNLWKRNKHRKKKKAAKKLGIGRKT